MIVNMVSEKVNLKNGLEIFGIVWHKRNFEETYWFSLYNFYFGIPNILIYFFGTYNLTIMNKTV